MASELLEIEVWGSRDAAEELKKLVDAEPGSESVVTEKRPFHGDPAEWIAIAQLVVKALPAVVSLVKVLVENKKIRKLRFGTTTIENPTAADVDRAAEAARSAK